MIAVPGSAPRWSGERSDKLPQAVDPAQRQAERIRGPGSVTSRTPDSAEQVDPVNCLRYEDRAAHACIRTLLSDQPAAPPVARIVTCISWTPLTICKCVPVGLLQPSAPLRSLTFAIRLPVNRSSREEDAGFGKSLSSEAAARNCLTVAGKIAGPVTPALRCAPRTKGSPLSAKAFMKIPRGGLERKASPARVEIRDHAAQSHRIALQRLVNAQPMHLPDRPSSVTPARGPSVVVVRTRLKAWHPRSKRPNYDAANPAMSACVPPSTGARTVAIDSPRVAEPQAASGPASRDSHQASRSSQTLLPRRLAPHRPQRNSAGCWPPNHRE